MLVADFDFDLPEELIAQEPLADRAGARMLALSRGTGAWEDRLFRDLPQMLRPGDLLVLNDSRVIPARLFAHRRGLHTQADRHGIREVIGRVQVLLAEQLSEWEWRALVRPGRKVLTGEMLTFGDETLQAEVIGHGEFGERTLRFDPVSDFWGAVDRLGHMPLPPYIRREDAGEDRERYQTVFAEERGSVAAPTAGLHFTAEMIGKLEAMDVETARVTLHVGLGTFAPLRVDRVDEVRLHRERYAISADAAGAVNRARREGRRIVAVGTTVVRTLESSAARSDVGEIEAGAGTTEIFISPGFDFKVVGAMLTNFHLPQSSLLMLVSAFAGRERVLAAYRHAVESRYRFFSYGDCMFIG